MGLEQTPSKGSAGTIDAPNIIARPLTPTARFKALSEESLVVFQKAKDRSAHYRNWDPLDLPFDEMEQLGSRLSPETITIIKGYMGVENLITDYMMMGDEGYRKVPVYLKIHKMWSGEELKHGIVLEDVLKHSGHPPDPFEGIPGLYPTT